MRNKALKACNVVKALAGVSWGVHPLNLIKVYKGYVRAILEWGSLCYANARKSDLKILDTVQNKALRIVSGLLKCTSIFSIHKLLDISPLAARRNLITDKYLMKASSIVQNRAIVKLNSLALILEKNKRKTSKLSFTLRRFEINRDILRTHPIHSTALPICYEYPIECQLLQVSTDIEVGHLLKRLDGAERSDLFFSYVQENYKGFEIIYTDASRKADSNQEYLVGAAFTHISKKTERTFRLDGNVSILEAEAYAIFKALVYAWSEGFDKTLIITDAMRVVEKLGKSNYSADSLSIILDIKCKILTQESLGKETVVAWLPRMGVMGSVEADRLAKEGGRKDNFENFLSNYDANKAIIEAKHIQDWHTTLSILLESDLRKNYIKNTAFIIVENLKKISRKFSREKCIKLARLISGYIADPEYLHKINVTSSKSCVCGFESCNLNHIMWGCPQHIIPRYQLLEDLANINYESPLTIQDVIIKRDLHAIKYLFRFLDNTGFKF